MRMVQLRLQIASNDICKALHLPHCKVRLEPKSESLRGLYNIRFNDVVIFKCVNGKVQSNEEIVETLLHELSHHLQHSKFGYTKHDEQFKKIFNEMKNFLQ